MDMYKIISMQRDTTHVDTSLTVQSDYRLNYLRKDTFGLLPFSNDGQTYNTLDFGLSRPSKIPGFGFKAKHFNYLRSQDVSYYHVPTAYTELYYRSAMEQGQNVDAFFTVNTSENLNFSIAYKGLRSVGKYINSLSSTGNFRFTTSYHTKSKRYLLNANVVYQDIYNAENGGIKNISEFEGGESLYNDRARLEVNLKDANTFLKGNSYFLNHQFRFNKIPSAVNLGLEHLISYDSKYFQYNQSYQNDFFGESYRNSSITDRTTFEQLQNNIGLTVQTNAGRFKVFTEQINALYSYDKVLYTTSGFIPNKISNQLNFVGGTYGLDKDSFFLLATVQKVVNQKDIHQIQTELRYMPTENLKFSLEYQNISKQPDYNYTLHQSSYASYNWFNSFKPEKYSIASVKTQIHTYIIKAELQSINNYMYFKNDSSSYLSVKPFQYSKAIQYYSFYIQKEFNIQKFALDNTILTQHVTQADKVINVPNFVLRNTFSYSDRFFKKALYMQMGVTFNYYSKYFANDYNPLLGEFYIQNQKQIGDFPVLDVFVNAKVKTARIYLKAEHINSSFSKNNFYSSPSNPYRDFIIRFGIIWTFFS